MLRTPLTLTSHSSIQSEPYVLEGQLGISLFTLLVLLLTLGSIAADQFIAPTLYSSSPLWATGALLALVWRRGGRFELKRGSYNFGFSPIRLALFLVAHAFLVSMALALHSKLAGAAGTISKAGWTVAALKLSVLLPTLTLLPLKRWRILARAYAAEGMAALVVLFTFFPSRFLAAAWPWYGQVLGRLVFGLSWFFVPGLTYAGGLTPTLGGADLDVTVLQACSGISGIELFDCLFALVAFLDWNRLRKGRTLIAYFAGIGVMFLGNAMRIAFLVVLGNRGFADAVAQFHISAGWIFFSIVFLGYLALIYRKLLTRPS